MITTLCDYIDQLDLALDQLALRDRNYDRFAMMLIDNVVELALHQHALDKHFEHQIYGSEPETTPEAKAVRDALSSRFDAKVHLALMVDLIPSDAAEAILQLHTFRNTAHHRGYRHEGILHSLSLFYFTICCDLLTAYRCPYWLFNRSEKLPLRAIKYVGNIDGIFGNDEVFASAWRRLKDVAESMGGMLATDLHNDMIRTIDGTDTAITFLLDGEPADCTRDSIVLDTQAWALASSDDGQKFAEKHGYAYSKVSELYAWLKTKYPIKVPTDPIPAWRLQAESVRTETSPCAALKKFTSFMNRTEKLRVQLEEAADARDRHIQMEREYRREHPT